MGKGQHSFSNFSPRRVDLESRGSQRIKVVTNTFIIIIMLPNHSQTACYMKGNCCSDAKLCLTLCDTMDCRVPGSSVLHCLKSLLKFISIESVMLSNHLILCHPLLPCPQSFPGIGPFPVRWLFISVS